MKIISLTLILTAVLLSACEPGTPRAVNKTSYNDGLQSNSETSDCKAYKVFDDNSCNCNYVVMIRCPSSTVTTLTSEKQPKTTITTSN